MPVWKPIIALPLTVWCNAQANMLDPIARKLIDKPLNALTNQVSGKISANSITIMGFFIGILSFIGIIKGQFTLALVFLALNRLCDGLDGAVARRQKPSDLGAYLDIIADFILWALLPLDLCSTLRKTLLPPLSCCQALPCPCRPSWLSP